MLFCSYLRILVSNMILISDDVRVVLQYRNDATGTGRDCLHEHTRSPEYLVGFALCFVEDCLFFLSFFTCSHCIVCPFSIYNFYWYL